MFSSIAPRECAAINLHTWPDQRYLFAAEPARRALLEFVALDLRDGVVARAGG